MKTKIESSIEIPEGVSVARNITFLEVKGPKGEVKRIMEKDKVKWKIENNKITLSSEKATKREKKAINTFTAHIKNMLTGVKQPFIYKLKACSGPPSSHFPMQISIANSIFSVKNFLGEKIPRQIKIRQGVAVKISGTDITVESPDIELAGKTSSDIEQLVRIHDKDTRIFQDGIYAVQKPTKKVA